MSTSTLPPVGLQEYALDLRLVCANNEPVLVCSKLLERATRSPAVADIIDKLILQHPHASADTPMDLPVPDDSAATWQVVWKLIENPMADPRLQGVDWANIEQVILLADKYALTHVLQACELFIVKAMTKKPIVIESLTSPFGRMTDDGIFDLQLPFLELLVRVQMNNAYEVLAPQFVQLLRTTAELKVKHNALHWLFIQASSTGYEKRSQELQVFDSHANKLSVSYEAALSSYSSSTSNPEAAARVVRFMRGEMGLIMTNLANVQLMY